MKKVLLVIVLGLITLNVIAQKSYAKFKLDCKYNEGAYNITFKQGEIFELKDTVGFYKTNNGDISADKIVEEKVIKFLEKRVDKHQNTLVEAGEEFVYIKTDKGFHYYIKTDGTDGKMDVRNGDADAKIITLYKNKETGENRDPATLGKKFYNISFNQNTIPIDQQYLNVNEIHPNNEKNIRDSIVDQSKIENDKLILISPKKLCLTTDNGIFNIDPNKPLPIDLRKYSGTGRFFIKEYPSFFINASDFKSNSLIKTVIHILVVGIFGILVIAVEIIGIIAIYKYLKRRKYEIIYVKYEYSHSNNKTVWKKIGAGDINTDESKNNVYSSSKKLINSPNPQHGDIAWLKIKEKVKNSIRGQELTSTPPAIAGNNVDISTLESAISNIITREFADIKLQLSVLLKSEFKTLDEKVSSLDGKVPEIKECISSKLQNIEIILNNSEKRTNTQSPGPGNVIQISGYEMFVNKAVELLRIADSAEKEIANYLSTLSPEDKKLIAVFMSDYYTTRPFSDISEWTGIIAGLQINGMIKHPAVKSTLQNETSNSQKVAILESLFFDYIIRPYVSSLILFIERLRTARYYGVQASISGALSEKIDKLKSIAKNMGAEVWFFPMFSSLSSDEDYRMVELKEDKELSRKIKKQEELKNSDTIIGAEYYAVNKENAVTEKTKIIIYSK